MTAGTLAALRALLPAGLVQMTDGPLPAGAVEAWYRVRGAADA
ncbi:MAG: hypothetical protein M0Z28_11480 [Rhodospirillales bacterium]|nr:hypothetical protein [Rhodospirillales bacterium]